MYTIVNKTSKEIYFENTSIILIPNNKITIENARYDIKIITVKGLGICELVSKYGEYTTFCYGNIYCTIEIGTDGPIFTICEK